MRRLSYTEALSRIGNTPREELYVQLYDSHKDFYGYKGRHMHGWSKQSLMEWFIDHFMWDNDEQMWRNQVPFYGEE